MASTPHILAARSSAPATNTAYSDFILEPKGLKVMPSRTNSSLFSPISGTTKSNGSPILERSLQAMMVELSSITPIMRSTVSRI